jgi:hypothetical protein
MIGLASRVWARYAVALPIGEARSGFMGCLHVRAAALALAGFSLAAPALADDLKLSGPEGQSATLSAADLAAMPHATLTVTIEGRTAT